MTDIASQQGVGCRSRCAPPEDRLELSEILTFFPIGQSWKKPNTPKSREIPRIGTGFARHNVQARQV